MKKEVQALLRQRRRRNRVVPAILAGLAGLIVIALIVLVAAVFTRGAGGLAFLASDTPTASLTPTLRPTNTPVPVTDTPAATPTVTNTPGPSPTPTDVVYVVESGDTLFSIAEQFGANVCLIMAVNNITDPSVLSVGQSLIIPPDDVELPTPTPLPTGLPRGARVEYIVQCGDTLDSIAAKFNSTGEDIASENDIDDPLSIRIGDVLIVRVNIATPTPTATPTLTPEGAAATTETPAPTATP
jgi:LysM repeat protein